MTLDQAVSAFGTAAKAKLDNPTATGQPEDQLRSPLETLFRDLAAIAGVPDVVLVGESARRDLAARLDFEVTVGGAQAGYIEVKAPGKGSDPRRFTGVHDKEQWEKLQALPNLIYTDGDSLSLWRDGELMGDVIHLGDVRTAGAALAAPPALLDTVQSFLQWDPTPPASVPELAETAARLCRFLRNEVEAQLAEGNDALVNLARGWRRLLFPEATDARFADGYAQAVTFGLLLARARDVDFGDGLDAVAKALRARNSLIGAALGLLTDEATDLGALSLPIGTMVRVFGVVDWGRLVTDEQARQSGGDRAEPWLYFYEDFLAVYDPVLRRETGSYYTPKEVVREMARLTDDVLQSPARFGRPLGLADPAVTVADPAVGPAAFLLAVLRRIATTLAQEQGEGAMRAALPQAVRRLIGFELQFGPYAVAQLRLTGEVADLMTPPGGAPPAELPDLRLFVTDTLGNPFEEHEDAFVAARLQPLAESRRAANQIKRDEPITVVIGNPPYKSEAMGEGGWVEGGDKRHAAPIDTWQPPPAWKLGNHARHLRNLYVYFWRWATWKAFGADRAQTQEEVDAAPVSDGVICYITAAGFIAGEGFGKMRADLRRDCSEIWVIDCSPEGHQPPVPTRIFEGVQQPVCIVLAARPPGTDAAPARVRFTALPQGPREAKFAALTALSLDGEAWADAAPDPRASFLPAPDAEWAAFPALDDLFAYDGTGVMAGRMWPIAPDADSLARRWRCLRDERDPAQKGALFRPHEGGDRTVTKPDNTTGIPGHAPRSISVADDDGEVVPPIRYAFRSFDRQYLIPDKRLINRENPTLWKAHSSGQLYLTAPTDKSPSDGPALTFSAAIPDAHHYNGRGGRVFPLWRDAAGRAPNVKPALLAALREAYRAKVTPRSSDDALGITAIEQATAEGVMAYLAAVAAHPGYVARFADDLRQPGLRVPLTADPELFAEAVRLGREVVWLHTFGERYGDGRPPGPPRVQDGPRPTVPDAIPPDADVVEYAAERQALVLHGESGTGTVENVPPAVWHYTVSSETPLIRQWVSYRKRDRSRPRMGKREPSALNEIQPDGWLPEYTTDLLDLVHVLTRLVALEPAQADLLGRIVAGPLLDADALRAAGAFAATGTSRQRAVDPNQTSLL